MTKYYRVRTQEQWDWLMKRFEEQRIYWICDETPTCFKFEMFKAKTVIEVKYDEIIDFSSVGYCVYFKNVTDFIEVSDLMEDEEMEKYVTIHSEDLNAVEVESHQGLDRNLINADEDGSTFIQERYLPADLLVPKSLIYPKITFTAAEKAEFDELKEHRTELFYAVRCIDNDYPALQNRLFFSSNIGQAQIEFARAWANPSLIEVLPEKKFNVKVPVANGPTFYYKTGDGVDVCKPSPTMQNLETTRFTAEEIKHYGLDNDLFEKVEVSE